MYMAFLDWGDERTYAKNTLIIMMTDWAMIGINYLGDIVTYDTSIKGWDNNHDNKYYTKDEIDTKISPITNQLGSIGTIYSSGQKTLSSLVPRTNTAFAPLTLEAGTYIIRAYSQCTNTPDNALIYTTIEGVDIWGKSQSIKAAAGDANNSVEVFAKLTQSTTAKLSVWSDVAINGTIYGELSAIRIA